MKIHTEHLTTDHLVAKPGGDVDLTKAGTFLLPSMPTAALPDPTSVQGMLVYDETANALKVSISGSWLLVATL